MNHRMAVWACRAKIFDGVYFVSLLNVRQGDDVMHMDQAFGSCAIFLRHQKTTAATAIPIVFQTCHSRARFSFIAID